MNFQLDAGEVLLACCLVEISCRPTNNELTTLTADVTTKEPKAIADKEDESISYQADNDRNVQQDSTKEIVDKIKAINNVLKKAKRPQTNRISPYSDNSNEIDAETLERIKQIIALEKLNSHSKIESQSTNRDIFNDEQIPYARASRVLPNVVYPNTIPMVPYYYYPYPYMNYPMLPVPNTNEILTKFAVHDGLKLNNIKSVIPSDTYQTRQEQQPLFPGFPSFPSFSIGNWFQFPPFSQLFPLLIKNPFVAFAQGGGLENFIEYGQSADVCSRKQKSSDDDYIKIIKKLVEQDVNTGQSDNNPSEDDTVSELTTNTRESRALRKRTILSGASEQEVDNKTPRKIFAVKPSAIRKTTTKKPLSTKHNENLDNDYDGSLRLPFGNSFSLFGDRKPEHSNPGFFINRLRVRKGGVAIAGPGGVATAGRGGTAIVGPGGLAYTKPGGLAIAGPHARVVALSNHHDFNDFVSEAAKLDDKLRSKMPIREGKLVATGPVIYYHSTEASTVETAAIQYIPFYGGAKGQYLEVKKDTKGAILSEKVVAEDSISSENILKNNDDNLLSKVLAANLQNLKSLSSNLLKIHTLGRKTGTLGHQERLRFKNQLFALGEAASNTIKLIDEIGEDVDVLFRRNTTLLRQYGDVDDEDVGEEGIGIDSASSGESYQGSLIAEAKPVGLAVVGESGLAASRPMATAVASSGVAIARPVGTAIAGIDPSLFNLDLHLNHQRSYKINGKYY